MASLALPLTYISFSRGFEAEADYLGVQYMYKTGYDPQAFVTMFEKLQAKEKKKPGTLSRAFSTHPQTPANQLVNARTIWLFAPGVLIAAYGAWYSMRYWRCPYCGAGLRTRFPIPRDCTRCGRDLGLGR